MSDGAPRNGPQNRPGTRDPDPFRTASTVQADVDRWQVRRLAIRVLLVQVFALAGLWLLQNWFGRP